MVELAKNSMMILNQAFSCEVGDILRLLNTSYCKDKYVWFSFTCRGKIQQVLDDCMIGYGSEDFKKSLVVNYKKEAAKEAALIEKIKPYTLFSCKSLNKLHPEAPANYQIHVLAYFTDDPDALQKAKDTIKISKVE